MPMIKVKRTCPKRAICAERDPERQAAVRAIKGTIKRDRILHAKRLTPQFHRGSGLQKYVRLSDGSCKNANRVRGGKGEPLYLNLPLRWHGSRRRAARPDAAFVSP
jgi:hypothetical protein